MSRQLLLSLNGNKKGKFAEWLNNFEGEPRIAWYPSAGEDFRDLLYLNPGFAKRNPANRPDVPSPDIFLHTDYFPWKYSKFLDSPIIYSDFRTTVTVQSIEELPRCDFHLDNGIVDFSDGSFATGKVLFIKVKVSSEILGSFSTSVLYVFMENGAFCAKRAIAQNARFSHIIHIRYGGGLGGGGKSSGIWILNVLGKLGCECFITDDHYHRQSGDDRTYELYPELAGPESLGQFDNIREIRGESWSNHGNVSWNHFKPC